MELDEVVVEVQDSILSVLCLGREIGAGDGVGV
jgi:hypothetical protein